MTSGTRISILSDHVANKIAAGEVVERPASVVKELLENAVDAGADDLSVDIVAGGRKLIAVADNGSGMSRDEALLSIERHATSKIRDVDDIERVSTMGFRGEALAAIAAVSRFELVTRRREDVEGTCIRLSGGTLQDVEEAGAPAGTRISVRNLFFNVPARRKFLRTDQTETSHVRQVFLVHALAHPGVGMRLRVDERDVYTLPPGDLSERIPALYSPTLMDSLREVAYRDEFVTLSGFVGLPEVHRPNRADQHTFINGRPAQAPLVHAALSEAYQGAWAGRRYPVTFLQIELDPEAVDVNVHPTKKEVRFRKPGAVRDAVIAGVQAALRSAGGTVEGPPEADRVRPAGGGAPPDPRREAAGASRPRPGGDAPPPAARQGYPGPRAPAGMRWQSDLTGWVQQGERTATPEDPGGDEGGGRNRLLGRIASEFAVFDTPEGMVLLDPKAAHERLIFERLLNQVLADGIQSQGLLSAETVDLGPREAALVRRHLDALREMGVGIAEFGGDSFVVDALPSLVSDAEPGELIREIAEGLQTLGTRSLPRTVLRERIARDVSGSAVRHRGPLSEPELEALLQQLRSADMPYTSPRGRPTMMLTSLQELRRKFGKE